MKIIFMGTPDFAAGALSAIYDAGYEVTLAVTQPDKPKGRSGKLIASPVKEFAISKGIPVFQPERINTMEAVAELKSYEADIYIVAAFGQIISREILDIPRLGCINIHASLLPKYRGASPIQQVIIDGEKKTGVTIMQMDEGIDTGDMLYKKEIPIEEDDTFESLHDKLTLLGGEAICEALPLLEEGELVPEKQNDEESSYAKLIKKEMGRLDFRKSAAELSRLIRGFNPWPGAYTFHNGRQLKIWCGEAVGSASEELKPGVIESIDRDAIYVSCGEGALKIKELQPEGKKRMSVRDFLNGAKLETGDRFE